MQQHGEVSLFYDIQFRYWWCKLSDKAAIIFAQLYSHTNKPVLIDNG